MENILFCENMKGLEIDRVVRDHEYSMVTRHFHSTYELYYLLEGERYYFIDKETYLVKQGDLVLIKPNQIHKTSLAETSYHDRVLLQIQGEMLDPFLKVNGFPVLEELYSMGVIVAVSGQERAEIEALLLQMGDELARKTIHHEAMVKLKLAELFLMISRHKASAAFYQENQRAQTIKHQKVHEVADYLLDHPEAGETLEELAKRFFISKSYLSRIFKEVTSFTVNEYRNISRIKKAQNLLVHGDYSVTEIAGMLGFESITYFERVFKNYVDMRPLQYRKEGRKR